MKDWRKTLIGPRATIHQAIKAIDSSSRQIALVVDAQDRLLGTVTDGDIRHRRRLTVTPRRWLCHQPLDRYAPHLGSAQGRRGHCHVWTPPVLQGRN